ncbi:DUF1707 domain-containing protein [Saccharopolyspora rhizosphaerae]|uniref:DUF1707 domain-containing protein n=2 Tax=Saccharopolyspora rhizosphaerae TaxID=2492662 RepID=A0A3R8NU97_9PSEU|nr:DUF1707 domain-containing protein [Saccharopolyspora rhizosphaerae]
MRLLGEHFSAGRLELAEYDERCRSAAAARFGSELDELFEDLPEPRPSRELSPAARRGAPPAGRIAIAVGAAAVLVALVLVARQFGLILLIPTLVIFWFAWRRG